MKKITFKNELTGYECSQICNSIEEENFYIEKIQNKPQIIGLNERWVKELNPELESRIIEIREIVLKEEYSYLDENNEEVIVPKVMGLEYHLPADYTIEIIDLEQEYNYLLQKCYENRRNAYGSWELQLDEIFHNGLESWKNRIEQIKLQFPKPTQE